MKISYDHGTFVQRKKSISDASDALRNLDVGSAPRPSGVVELSGVDEALSHLYAGAKTVRKVVSEKLEDSNSALSEVQEEFQAVEIAQLERVAKIMESLS